MYLIILFGLALATLPETLPVTVISGVGGNAPESQELLHGRSTTTTTTQIPTEYPLGSLCEPQPIIDDQQQQEQ